MEHLQDTNVFPRPCGSAFVFSVMSGPEGASLDVCRDQKGRFHFVEKWNSEEQKNEANLEFEESNHQGIQGRI